jgi:CheY-like chemotaxis protein
MGNLYPSFLFLDNRPGQQLLLAGFRAMVFLVAEASPAVRQSLCYALLSFGVKGIPVATRQEALAAIDGTSELTGAIIDIDSKDIEGVELIRQLREAPQTQGLLFMVHTVQSTKDVVEKMMEYGVVGYLLKPYKEQLIYPKLQKILTRLESHHTQRRHIRVKPDPEALLRLHFKLPDYPSMISGKVVDISVGGVAVELFNPPKPEVLAPGTPIPSIEFTIGRQSFRPPGKVVLFKERLLALRFDYLSAAEKTAMSKYVFKRITS